MAAILKHRDDSALLDSGVHAWCISNKINPHFCSLELLKRDPVLLRSVFEHSLSTKCNFENRISQKICATINKLVARESNYDQTMAVILECSFSLKVNLMPIVLIVLLLAMTWPGVIDHGHLYRSMHDYMYAHLL